MDEYQERYMEHQDRKKKMLDSEPDGAKIFYNISEILKILEIMENRRSQRNFIEKPIKEVDIEVIKKAVSYAPSSCNRQAVYLKEIEPYEFEELFVGARKWSLKANKIYLIFAAKEAYKSPNEKAFMPYLDAGFVAQNIYLISEVLGIGSCFVNPNIRQENVRKFNDNFNIDNDYICGAMVLGNYENKAKTPPIRDIEGIVR